MKSCQKRYFPVYLQLKEEFDPKVREWINNKEDLISSAPLANPSLKHTLHGIRRFKSGKLRILYALSSEKPEIWSDEPTELEIMFLYVDLRSEETYSEALRLLKKEGLL
jgi:mRNA-degrading endonuclease RelE of RelBE toxin-antitoxin system